MKQPQISVVIPVFNGDKYLKEALESVESQTLEPKEIIIVNDGSTDNSMDVVSQFRSKIEVNIVNKSNGGQSSARNAGVAIASSDYVAFLDQDDIWYPRHLEVLANEIVAPKTRPTGYIYGNLDRIDSMGRMVDHQFLNAISSHPKRSLCHCISNDMFIVPSATIVSRQAFNEIGGFDEVLCGYEDDDMFLRLFRAGYQGIYVEEVVSKWRIYSGSTSYSPRMDKSRMNYYRKLARTYGNDKLFNDYWLRDHIAPRFIRTLTGKMRIASINGEILPMRGYWENIKEVASELDFREKWKIMLLLPFIEVSIFLGFNRTTIFFMELGGW
jgi:glycosyltransferase involved in cell wall biosynthesis